jgi:hypothetical protein
MDRRHIVSIFCIAAIAFACGPHPRARVEAAARQITGSARPAPQRPRATDTLPHVDAALRIAGEAAMRFELAVTNASARRIELDFPDGQTREFVVLDSVGREVWRWSHGRLFTQTMQNRPLTPGDSLVYDEEWTPEAPGRYTVIAQLRSENFPVVRQATFTIPSGAALATR